MKAEKEADTGRLRHLKAKKEKDEVKFSQFYSFFWSSGLKAYTSWHVTNSTLCGEGPLLQQLI